MARPDKPVILLLAVPETSPSVLYGLYDVLYTVGATYPELTAGVPGPEELQVRIVSADCEPFRCLGGVMVEPHAAIADIESADAVVVCDTYTPIDRSLHGKFLREIEWLRRMHAQGALLCSVCSGTLLLAEAGLLDGREAAAHWAYGELFRRSYPSVRLNPRSVLCLTAEPDRIVTAAAVTAWQDLALYLIARFCGHRLALQTAKVHLLAGHDEGQLPYAAMRRPQSTADAVIVACQTWMASNYACASPVQRMTERSGLNARTFARRFQATTGYQPMEYVQSLRVEEAKQMLEAESLAIDEVAAAVGYEDPASFRRVFKRKAGLTPAAYRRKFQRMVPQRERATARAPKPGRISAPAGRTASS
jgi:transcriptional regulator GlxA family with amidase domain